MRFMKPDTAEKFLQSHYCKIIEIMHDYHDAEVCLGLLFSVEEQICKDIFKLQHYRQLGITTFKGEQSGFSIAVIA